jgi:phosphopantothenoylcysteine decarboxylase/phosphopantothenate--cysteine ligase
VELLRRAQDEGAEVHVVMSAAATRFVTPLTFRTLSGFPVLTALYDQDLAGTSGDADATGVDHIDLVKRADLVVVAPATANTIAKAANGIADDAFTTVLSAAGTNVLWAPAMNHRMWKNPATRENVARLVRMGHQVIDVEDGWMACREYGPGRMAEPETILERIVERIGQAQDLAGVRVLVTAGRTEEPLDAVRILTNRSSGKTGVALAEAARDRGAIVTLLAGPVDVDLPGGVTVERVTTAGEMAETAGRLFTTTDLLIMAAAVGDFRAATPRTDKIRREPEGVSLDLVANPDILAGLARNRRPEQILIGFALEAGADLAAGREKLARKGVDLLVLNDPGTAIGADTNAVTLLVPGEPEVALPVLTKTEVAGKILDWAVARRSAGPRKVPVEKP